MLIRHLALLALTVALSADTLPAIPPRPEALKFPALNYEPPDPRQYRVALKAGPVAYVVPDRELPLVTVSILVRARGPGRVHRRIAGAGRNRHQDSRGLGRTLGFPGGSNGCVHR